MLRKHVPRLAIEDPPPDRFSPAACRSRIRKVLPPSTKFAAAAKVSPLEDDSKLPAVGETTSTNTSGLIDHKRNPLK